MPLHIHELFLRVLTDSSHSRILTREEEEVQQLRVIYGWLCVVASGLRYLRIVTSSLRKHQSVDNRQKIFDMSTHCLSFHGSLTVYASCDELFTDTSELFTDACD